MDITFYLLIFFLSHQYEQDLYVVNHLQPGNNRGNWAVRNKNKIFSSHRTKKVAIKNARILAKKRETRVLVQNIHGRFSYGFNPKKNN